MEITLRSAVAQFGRSAKAKLANTAVAGGPEDQLRAPLERLLGDLAELCGQSRDTVVAVGESSLVDIKTRPDYAITVHNALCGFLEVKAPGKGADPRRFRDPHDKTQWEKLQSLPNLIYTDGNAFSLWRSGQIEGAVVHLVGYIESAGAELDAPSSLLHLFESFLSWEPVAPRSAKQLAMTTARLCRLLRDEVTEQLQLRSRALTDLATDWRKLLFPDATDAEFADGYAQAVTFGLLMARARNISLATGIGEVARQLGQANSLIGAALRLLTDDAHNQASLKTSLDTLRRVLNVVHWPTISKGDPEAWLYFYEDFLDVYDKDLRRLTGSYYTPPEVVAAMVRLVDEVLRSPRFNLPAGLASSSVVVADPAVGTGTFLLGVLRCIAKTVEADEGAGAVGARMQEALARLVGFEVQLGPFAVAQLRIIAELAELAGPAPLTPLRMFVADTLSNPYEEQEWIPALLKPLADSRREANTIKRQEAITIVIGNPPYKEKAKGRGGWVESGSANSPQVAPFNAWMPPPDWGVSVHAKHLRNLYVYFWRWATWKVFDHDPKANTGIVCFITVSGFLNGDGFQKMRDYLRRTTDEIWVIDCSPEGHQPEVNTRIFQGVQHPVCIVIASRSPKTDPEKPATVLFHTLPAGHRSEKFAALSQLKLPAIDWSECPSEWRAPFLPKRVGAWATYPALDDLFLYKGSGVMPGRTWIIAPDADSLRIRWERLITAPDNRKELLFHPHLLNGQPGDRHSKRIVNLGLPHYRPRTKCVAEDADPCVPPLRYAFRSFDRQWIIPDNRLINRPNPELWEIASERQVFLTAPSDRSPTDGPALTFTALIPDLHHYSGRGGRVYPLWGNSGGTVPNVPAGILSYLSKRYGKETGAEDLLAYIAGVASHPAFVARFLPDLTNPGLRIPITTDGALFAEAAEIGRRVIWLHTFGERYCDPASGRSAQPPRLSPERAPRVPTEGAIPRDPSGMPDEIDHDATRQRLLVGRGYIEGVTAQMWNYTVSGKQVLPQWFSYRKADRDRPIIGDRRPPSPLGDIQPDHWLAEYTTELLNLLHVIGLLIELEALQAEILEKICAGPTISAEELCTAEVATSSTPALRKKKRTVPDGQQTLLD